MDEVSAIAVVSGVSAGVAGSFVKAAGADVYKLTKAVVSEMLEGDFAGNLRSILQRVADEKATGPGMLPADLHYVADRARYASHDSLQDLWAKLIAAAIRGEIIEGEVRWAADQLNYFSPAQAIAISLFNIPGPRYALVNNEWGKRLEKACEHLMSRGLVHPSCESPRARSGIFRKHLAAMHSTHRLTFFDRITDDVESFPEGCGADPDIAVGVLVMLNEANLLDCKLEPGIVGEEVFLTGWTLTATGGHLRDMAKISAPLTLGDWNQGLRRSSAMLEELVRV